MEKSSESSRWSSIVENPAYLEKLQLLCHSEQELKAGGYVMVPLMDIQIQSKAHCERCGTRTRFRPPNPLQKQKIVTSFRKNDTIGLCDLRKQNKDIKPTPKARNAQVDRPTRRDTSQRSKGPSEGRSADLLQWTTTTNGSVQVESTIKKSGCKSHPGRVAYRKFVCCAQPLGSDGCEEHDYHLFLPPTDPYVRLYWQYHRTTTASPFFHNPQARKVIALDCEMGTSLNLESELIRLTAIDFFTRQTLVDKLVQPTVPMKHYNTRYSGVTPEAMRNAVKSGNCYRGRDEARNRLLELIGPETIVVMHGGNNDLTALRLIHPLVIDTHLLECYNPKTEGGRSLKVVCKKHLGMNIQAGKNGHDSLEDAEACRELLHFWIKSIPD